MSCSCQKKKSAYYNPPEIDHLLANRRFDKFSKEDLLAFYFRFKDISHGKPDLNKKQFVKLLNSFNMFPNDLVAHRLFSVVDIDNSGQLDFEEFMKYLFMLLEGTQKEKTGFIFKMIAGQENENFKIDDLTDYYMIINNDEFGSYKQEGSGEMNEAVEMSRIVFDLMNQQADNVISKKEFHDFIEEDSSNIQLFNFLNNNLEDSAKQIKFKQNFMQMFKVMEALQNDVFDIEETLFPGSADTKKTNRTSKFFRKVKFSLNFNSVVYEKIKNKPDMLVKESFRNIIAPKKSNTDASKKKKRTSWIGAINDSMNWNNKDLKKNEKKIYSLVNAIKNKLDYLFDVMEKENESSEKETNLNENLKNNIKPTTETKKVVFINDPNWNIVTSMINGIQKSLKIVAGDQYKSLTKSNFKSHNTIHIEAMYSNKFDKCKFKDYAPYVFQSIRNAFGISYEDYIKSLGVNTFKNAFYDKLYLMLSSSSTGKSGSFFFHTSDGKYMIKTIKKSEFDVLMNMLPSYHEHLLSNPETLISRYYGLHQMKCYNNKDLVYDIYVIVMNNVFVLDNPELIEKTYDLKGSTYKRRTKEEGIKKNHARKDLNFLNEGMVVNIPHGKRQLILEQIDKDALFLADNSIIDYSLLLGVVDARHDRKSKSVFDVATKRQLTKKKSVEFTDMKYYMESTDGLIHYYFGIIDTLTFFGSKKRGEFVAKRVFQGSGISCVPPKAYKKRFCEFMEKIMITDL